MIIVQILLIFWVAYSPRAIIWQDDSRLVGHGSKIRTPLTLLVSRNDRRKCIEEAILENNIDHLNTLIFHSTTPSEIQRALRFASYNGKLKAINLLASHTHELHHSDESGCSAIHYAVFGKEHEAVSLLVDYKADINSIDNIGFTPLHHAVQLRYMDMICTVVKCGGNISAVDNQGDQAIHIASKMRDVLLTKMLLIKKADLGRGF